MGSLLSVAVMFGLTVVKAVVIRKCFLWFTWQTKYLSCILCWCEYEIQYWICLLSWSVVIKLTVVKNAEPMWLIRKENILDLASKEQYSYNTTHVLRKLWIGHFLQVHIIFKFASVSANMVVKARDTWLVVTI